MPGPLDGIHILDFTRYQNGPHATSMLSDMGADVLKVELPGDGDPGRSLGRLPDGFCSYFEGNNRGKRSITLDLRKPEAREIVYKLVAEVDVVTENFRQGVMDGLGLGYEELRKHNEQLIYGSTTGFGPIGEWSQRASFDHIAQGMSGALIAQGGGPGKEPQAVQWGLADQSGSIVFAYGIMSAIVARERFGTGQRVDASLLGSMMTVQNLTLANFLHTKHQEVREGAGGYNQAAFGWHQAGDGKWLTVGVLDPKDWPGLCRAIGREDLISDERSADAFARREHAAWLLAEVKGTLLTRPRQHWLERILAERVPCGPVLEYAEVLAEPQFWDNGYIVEVEHPQFDDYLSVGVPVRFSETPGAVQGPAPELGQHTEEVLLSLGYDWKEIERLHDERVTAAG